MRGESRERRGGSVLTPAMAFSGRLFRTGGESAFGSTSRVRFPQTIYGMGTEVGLSGPAEDHL